MVATLVDYTTYFEFPTLDKIHGEPTFATLLRMKKQLKANAISITSDLGGGQFGHLGLVLTPPDYALLSPVPYARPAHIGALVIPAGTAQHEAIRLRDEHKENIRLFRETIDVEKVLIKLIVGAVEAQYLKELRDHNTDTINDTVADVLAFLFDRYGEVDSETLDDHEAKVRSLFWTLSDPPVTLFNKVEDLVELADAARLPKTNAQIVNMGLHIIRKTQDLEQALTAWFARPVADRTWLNFKEHFSSAYRALKKVRGPAMRSTTFQANLMAEQLNENIERMKTEVLASVNALVTHTPAPNHSQVPTPLPSVNATTNGVTTNDLVRLIADLQQQVAHLKPPTSTPGQGGGPQLRRRRNTSKYCWTHGACSHSSAECNNKREGHQDSATFANKQGGSTYYCQDSNN